MLGSTKTLTFQLSDRFVNCREWRNRRLISETSSEMSTRLGLSRDSGAKFSIKSSRVDTSLEVRGLFSGMVGSVCKVTIKITIGLVRKRIIVDRKKYLRKLVNDFFNHFSSHWYPVIYLRVETQTKKTDIKKIFKNEFNDIDEFARIEIQKIFLSKIKLNKDNMKIMLSRIDRLAFNKTNCDFCIQNNLNFWGRLGKIYE